MKEWVPVSVESGLSRCEGSRNQIVSIPIPPSANRWPGELSCAINYGTGVCGGVSRAYRGASQKKEFERADVSFAGIAVNEASKFSAVAPTRDNET